MESTVYIGKDGYTVTVESALFELNEDGEYENMIDEGMWAIIQEQDGERIDIVDVRFSREAAHTLAKQLIKGEVHYA